MDSFVFESHHEICFENVIENSPIINCVGLFVFNSNISAEEPEVSNIDIDLSQIHSKSLSELIWFRIND